MPSYRDCLFAGRLWLFIAASLFLVSVAAATNEDSQCFNLIAVPSERVQECTFLLESAIDAQEIYDVLLARALALSDLIDRLPSKEFDMAASDLQAALNLGVDNLEALKRLAILHGRAKNYEKSIELLDDSIALNPNILELYILRGSAKTELSSKFRDTMSDRYTYARDAIVDLDRVLLYEPQNNDALRTRARAYGLQRDLVSATRDYDRLLTLVPNDLEGLLSRARLYFIASRWTNSLADYNRFLQLDADNAIVLGERGNCHAAMANMDEAVSDYRRALNIRPGDSRILNDLNWALARSRSFQ